LRAGGGDREESLLGAYLATAFAIRAGLRAARAAARASAVACIALGEALELDDFFGALGGFLEFDFEIIAKIITAAGARARTPAAGAEKIAKDVGEDFLEALGEVEAAERTGALRALERGVTEAIILRAAFRIGEDLVGLVDFLETLFGFFVAGIAIGMELDCEAAVGLFQFLVTARTS